jgi:hypothetical protein
MNTGQRTPKKRKEETGSVEDGWPESEGIYIISSQPEALRAGHMFRARCHGYTTMQELWSCSQ